MGQKVGKMSITHNLVTGDVTQYQDKLKQSGIYGQVIGRKGKLTTLPTDQILEAETQRDTAVQWAYSQLIKRGGIDMGIFDPISVIDHNGRYICYDGLGRLAMYQLMGIQEIECWVCEGDEVIAADLFGTKNKHGIRTVKPESIFNSDYRAHKQEAEQDVKALKKVGLSVRVRKDMVLPESSQDPQIKINQFRKIFKYLTGDYRNKLDVIRQARDIIVQAFAQDQIIRADLLGGLSILLDVFPDMRRPGKPYDQLAKFLQIEAMTKTQTKLPYKKDGGNQHNAEFESVAYGLLRNFTASKVCTDHTAQFCRHHVLRDQFNLAEIRN